MPGEVHPDYHQYRDLQPGSPPSATAKALHVADNVVDKVRAAANPVAAAAGAGAMAAHTLPTAVRGAARAGSWLARTPIPGWAAKTAPWLSKVRGWGSVLGEGANVFGPLTMDPNPTHGDSANVANFAATVPALMSGGATVAEGAGLMARLGGLANSVAMKAYLPFSAATEAYSDYQRGKQLDPNNGWFDSIAKGYHQRTKDLVAENENYRGTGVWQDGRQVASNFSQMINPFRLPGNVGAVVMGVNNIIQDRKAEQPMVQQRQEQAAVLTAKRNNQPVQGLTGNDSSRYQTITVKDNPRLQSTWGSVWDAVKNPTTHSDNVNAQHMAYKDTQTGKIMRFDELPPETQAQIQQHNGTTASMAAARQSA
jgi:hypothetical protein